MDDIRVVQEVGQVGVLEEATFFTVHARWIQSAGLSR